MTAQLPVELVGNLADTFLFHRMTAREELGRLFELDLDCLSERHDVRSTDVLGQTMTVRLELPQGGWRYFDGHVCRFEYLGVTPTRHFAHYRLVLRPWLWFLTRSADCRIFQDRTVPEILTEVFREHGFSDFQTALYGEYRRWEYCVQYRESDFDFVSRLMEQEGIYYFFRHEFGAGCGRHTLVLADEYSAHARAAGYEAVSFLRSTRPGPGEAEGIGEWRVSHEIEPDVYSLGDFDFTRPKAGLLVSRRAAPEVQPATGRVYDYPGEYLTRPDGEAYVRTRMEELQAQHERAHATASTRGLAVGNLFELHDHPRADQNREYLVVSAVHTLRSVAYETELQPEAPDAPVYRCELTAMPSHLPYRSPRSTPRPVVEGPQTAIVVGPAGEKVWTDNYARVKVRFHWDHRDTDTAGATIPDDRRSCWLRVSQNWAGQQWGELYLPHVGQEVIVSFLEGDPDRPLVTGRVYNADQMPPLDLPREKYKSVVARDSYGNKIVFDGTPGDEHIAMFSPHHRSMLQLGKSVVTYSDSDDDSWKIGNTVDVQIGTALEAFVGMKADVSFAGSIEASLGSSFTWRFGRDVEWTLRDVFKELEEDYIIESSQTVSFAASDEKPGRTGKSAIFYAGHQSLELSVGSEKHSLPPSDKPWYRRTGAQLLMGVAATAATAFALQEGGGGEDESMSRKLGCGVPAAAALLTSLGLLAWWSLRVGVAPQPIRHDDQSEKDSWLTLEKNSAEFDATDALLLGYKARSVDIGNRQASVNLHSKVGMWQGEEGVTIIGKRVELGA